MARKFASELLLVLALLVSACHVSTCHVDRGVQSATEALVLSEREHGRPGREVVILIVVDALRPDHMSVNGYPRKTSPELDRLANDGLYVPRMMAHAPQTAPSVASILTSTFPHRHGVQYHSGMNAFGADGSSEAPLLPRRVETLPELYSRSGYFTVGIVANPWVRHEYGYSQGFDRYVQMSCHALATGVCDGALINQHAIKTLDEHRADKLFLYLHYMDVHNPYAHNGRLPSFFRSGEGSLVYRNGLAPDVRRDDLEFTIAAYDDGIRYVDSLVGDLVARLETRDRVSDTLIVVTSDHGDEFLEHGGLGHGTTLFPELLGSFAIFWSPKKLDPARYDALAGSVDISPTMLGLSGVPVPPGLEGMDLLQDRNKERAQVLFSELASAKAAALDDLVLVADSRDGTRFSYIFPSPENSPVVSDVDVDLLDELEAQLRSIPWATETQGAELDPKARERLEAIGYLN